MPDISTELVDEPCLGVIDIPFMEEPDLVPGAGEAEGLVDAAALADAGMKARANGMRAAAIADMTAPKGYRAKRLPAGVDCGAADACTSMVTSSESARPRTGYPPSAAFLS
jgi:hypothetical protein